MASDLFSFDFFFNWTKGKSKVKIENEFSKEKMCLKRIKVVNFSS